MSLLARAHRLLALGLSVIPVPRAGAGFDGKTPVLRWKAYQYRLPTPEELTAWFVVEDLNLAVITGAVSGVVVVDVDARDAESAAAQHFPETPWRTQTAHGLHRWYQHPGGHIGNRTRIALVDDKLPLDVRGDGGYVMAPGSVHASGASYRFAGDWTQPKTSLPVFSPDWLLRSREHTREEVTNRERIPPKAMSTVDAMTRARAYLAAVPRPEIGQGSDAATFTAACRLTRGFNLSAADAEALLWEWCGNRAGWTREWVAHKVTYAIKYGSEKYGGLLR